VLLLAFPVIFLGRTVSSIDPVVGPIGWGLAWWALGLYWAAAVLYLMQTRQLLRVAKTARNAAAAIAPVDHRLGGPVAGSASGSAVGPAGGPDAGGGASGDVSSGGGVGGG
jgi:hypothetical protein